MKKIMPLVIVFLFFITVWWIYGRFFDTSGTITVTPSSYEDAFNTKAVLIRTEYPLRPEAEGTLFSVAAIGQRVSRLQPVAYIYSKDEDAKILYELKEINREIKEIESSMGSVALISSDTVSYNKRINSIASDLSLYGKEGNADKIHGLALELNMILDKKNKTTSVSIDSLIEKKTEIEKKLGSRSGRIDAKGSGVYFDSTDGYEDTLKISDIEKLTYKDIEAVIANSGVNAAAKAPCKTVDTAEWVVAFTIPLEEAANLKTGTRLNVRLTGESAQSVGGTVLYVSPPSDNKCVAAVKCTSYINNVYTKRLANVDIIKKAYTGFRIPKKAIHTGEDGEPCVYVQKGEALNKTKVNIIFDSDDFVIVSDSKSLALYDKVVVSSKVLKGVK